MTFKAQRLAFAKILNTHYPQEEINSFFYLLTEHYFGLNKFETHQKDAEELPSEHQQHFSEALLRLKQQMPIQYIIGGTEFYGYLFKVNEHTLIPRPETEELVEWIIADFKDGNDNVAILDIGTGSGCVAISLAKELKNASVSAIDISEGAIAIAQDNAKLNEVDVHFLKQDILISETLSKQYDVFVSNPPYVRQLEKSQMPSNVLEHEPASALFVTDEDPLVFYKKIAQLALMHLKEGGFLYFEINEYLGGEITDLINNLGFKNNIIKKDIYGKNRMMRATR